MDFLFAGSLNRHISKVGLGCVTFGREIDLSTSFSIMDYALDKEITLFDTAAAYGQGTSERVIGQWFSERGRNAANITIATKLLPPFKPHSLATTVEECLSRLRRDRIDILYVHSWHPSIELEDVLMALNNLLVLGKIGALGVSNFNAVQLSAMLQKQIKGNLIPVSFLQNNQNFAVTEVDDELRQLCRKFNVNIVTYSPLGAGFLTGKYQNAVPRDVRFEIIPGHKEIYFKDHSWQRLQKLLTVAKLKKLSPAKLALAWALRQPQVLSVLVGCRSIQHLDQAIKALHISSAKSIEALLDV